MNSKNRINRELYPLILEKKLPLSNSPQRGCDRTHGGCIKSGRVRLAAGAYEGSGSA
jgi:hypothetical protein